MHSAEVRIFFLITILVNWNYHKQIYTYILSAKRLRVCYWPTSRFTNLNLAFIFVIDEWYFAPFDRHSTPAFLSPSQSCDPRPSWTHSNKELSFPTQLKLFNHTRLSPIFFFSVYTISAVNAPSKSSILQATSASCVSHWLAQTQPQVLS